MKNLVASFHFEDSEIPDVSEIGTKAAQLFQIPPAWTPPFLVVTHQARLKNLEIALSGDQWIERAAQQSGCLSYLNKLISEAEDLIVRSSAIETLADRGRLYSQPCASTIKALEESIRVCWEKNLHILGDEGRVALIIQRKLSGEIGHVSNERRVSERHDSWLVELTDAAGVDRAFRITSLSGERKTDSLECKTPSERTGALRNLVTHKVGGRGRRHYEWLWDGTRLWALQCDFEKSIRGKPPGSQWKHKGTGRLDSLSSLVAAKDTKTLWAKTECIRVFEECNLPTSPMFVLEDPKEILALSKSEVSSVIEGDIRKLAALPTVVRTDISPQLEHDALLLPRTETCRSASDIKSFLIKTSQHFVEKGISPSQFCFLAHSFIPARAGSYSYSRPQSSHVRIDSTWGLPDGLLYFPHDSFEFDVTGGYQISATIRCKHEYVDVKEDGDWFEKMAGTSWDWKESLTDAQRSLIAEQALTIAKHLDCPIELMHFVGVSEETDLPDCLPWYFRKTDIEVGDVDYASRLTRSQMTVSRPEDFSRLESILEAGAKTNIRSFRLRAAPEYLRSQEFIDQAAEFAKSHELAIDLEGSVLAHTFYLLRKKGARVRSLGLEDSGASRSSRVFEKLVRDKIPSIIREKGEAVFIRSARDEELVELLKRKLIEEVIELTNATIKEDLHEEAADIYEVLVALASLLGEDEEDIAKRAAEKRAAKGGFSEGVFLQKTVTRPAQRDVQAGRLFGLESQADEKRRPNHNLPPNSLLPATLILEGSRVQIKIPLTQTTALKGLLRELDVGNDRISIRVKEESLVLELRRVRPRTSNQLTLPLDNPQNPI